MWNSTSFTINANYFNVEVNDFSSFTVKANDLNVEVKDF